MSVYLRPDGELLTIKPPGWVEEDIEPLWGFKEAAKESSKRGYKKDAYIVMFHPTVRDGGRNEKATRLLQIWGNRILGSDLHGRTVHGTVKMFLKFNFYCGMYGSEGCTGCYVRFTPELLEEFIAEPNELCRNKEAKKKILHRLLARLDRERCSKHASRPTAGDDDVVSADSPRAGFVELAPPPPLSYLEQQSSSSRSRKRTEPE